MTALLTGAFVVSRMVYAALGVRFDASPLGTYWQYVDAELLRDDLWRSLWFMHAQPPLYNLLVGGALELGGGAWVGVLHAVSLAAGLLLTLSLHRLLRAVGAGPRTALALTALLALAPPAVLYETWLYVDYLVTALLVVTALHLHRFAATGRWPSLAVVLAAASFIVLSRTIFHLVWLVALVGLLWLSRPDRRRLVLGASAAALVLCGGVYAKNAALYGSPSATSCFGISAARTTTFRLDQAERERLVAEGVLSEYALRSPFALPLLVPDEFEREEARGVPVLDQPITSTGTANFNHTAYVRLCRQYLDDAIAVATHQPGTVAGAVKDALLIFARPAGDYALFTEDNREAVAPLHRAYNLVVLGQVRPHATTGPDAPAPGSVNGILEIGWVVVALYGAVLVLAVPLVRWALRERGRDPVAAVVLFAAGTIGYIVVIGNAFEAGENNRFHFLLDPLAVVVLTVVVTRARARAPRDRGRP